MRFLYKWVPWLFPVLLIWRFREHFIKLALIWSTGDVATTMRTMVELYPQEWREFASEVNAQREFENKEILNDSEILERMG